MCDNKGMEKLYRMNEVAEVLGVTIKTLQRWDQSGKVQFIRTANGQRRLAQSELNKLLGVIEDEPIKKVVIYARVSSHEQKKKGDLDRQVEMVKEKLKGKPFSSIEVIIDVGSGLNDKRKGLLKVMKMAEEHEMTDLAIRYKDRLTRFGFEYLNLYFKSHNVTIHVLDDQKEDRNIQEELVDDLMSIIASFSGKMYGIRSHKNKALKEKVKDAIEDVANLSDQTEADSTSKSFNI